MRLIPLRVAPWPGGSVAGSPWGKPLLMSVSTYLKGESEAGEYLMWTEYIQDDLGSEHEERIS